MGSGSSKSTSATDSGRQVSLFSAGLVGINRAAQRHFLASDMVRAGIVFDAWASLVLTSLPFLLALSVAWKSVSGMAAPGCQLVTASMSTVLSAMDNACTRVDARAMRTVGLSGWLVEDIIFCA